MARRLTADTRRSRAPVAALVAAAIGCAGASSARAAIGTPPPPGGTIVSGGSPAPGTPTPAPTSPSGPTAPLPPSGTDGTSPIPGPSQVQGGTLARVVANTSALSAPVDGKRVMKLTPWTSFSHEPQTLLVLGSAYIEGQQWLRVLLPVRPDGSTAWVTTNQVVLSHTDYWITVRQSARRVLVYRQGVLRRSFLAVIGKPSTPTPTGLGAIYEEDPEPSPNDFLGTWALPLTLLSHALTSFDGGPGRVAIHGRGGTSLLDPLGQALSHGCIRIDNGNVGWIATHVPIGTPVDITP